LGGFNSLVNFPKILPFFKTKNVKSIAKKPKNPTLETKEAYRFIGLAYQGQGYCV
jgi:hypothetical protein